MRVWVPALAAAMLAAGAPAYADVADFDGAEIMVGSPAGYCTIGEEQFSVLPTLLLTDDPGDILTAFARCEEIDEVAAGSADTFRHYGLIVGLRDGEGEAIRPDRPMEEYLAEYDAAQLEAQASGPRATSVGMNSDLAVQVEPVGLVSKTDQAHFAAMTIRPEASGRAAAVAVIGRTLVDGRAVQVELYAPEEEAPIPELILLGHDTVAALWDANPATAGSGTVTADTGMDMDADAEADPATEEDSLASDEGLSEDEELAAAFDQMSAQIGASFQILYWAVVLYLSASILLGIGIWGSFKLRPRPA